MFGSYFALRRKRALLERLNEPTLHVPLNWVTGSRERSVTNLGDALSPVVVSAISGRPVVHRAASDPRERMIAIGTIGQSQRAATVHVWGTGYSSERGAALRHDEKFQARPAPHFVVHATRGPISRQGFRDLGFDSPPIYGDPAWFVPRILPLDEVRPRYELGVVLHISEVDGNSPASPANPEYSRYNVPPSLGDQVRIITTYVDASIAGIAGALRTIKQCRRIVSTSFHGHLLAEAYGIPCAHFSLQSGGLQRIDARDASSQINERFRDFALGTGSGTSRLRRARRRNLTILCYGQDRSEPTDWEDVIDQIDRTWEPLHVDAEEFLAAFPLPLAVAPDAKTWNVEIRELPNIVTAAPAPSGKEAASSRPAARPAGPASGKTAIRPPGAIPPSSATGRADAQPNAATVEKTIALLVANKLDAALGIIGASGDSAKQATILFATMLRLVEQVPVARAAALCRKLLANFAPQIKTTFTPRAVHETEIIDAEGFKQTVEKAGSGTGPGSPQRLILERRADRIPIGRDRDTILLVPRLVIAGSGTPYFLGGHSPMSADGHWFPGYTQGGVGGDLNQAVWRLQAANVDIEALVRVPSAVFVVAGGWQNNYGHAIFNALPSLYWYKALGLECPLILPRLRLDVAPALAEALRIALAALGIPEARVMNESELAGKCFALGIMPNAGDFGPETVAFYRTLMLPHLNRSNQASPSSHRRVYVSRMRAHTHRISNEGEIVKAMSRHGFHVAELETMPFREQVALFENAEVVAGPHGSGFNNMFFAKPGTRLIEIRTTPREDFVKLTSSAGQHYTGLQARAVTGEEGPFVFDDFAGLERECVAPATGERSL